MAVLKSLGLDETGAWDYVVFVSWLDGRFVISLRKGEEESPGSLETRCRVMPGGGDPRDSATESKPPVLPSGGR